jgi:hypothetical protein
MARNHSYASMMLIRTTRLNQPGAKKYHHEIRPQPQTVRTKPRNSSSLRALSGPKKCDNSIQQTSEICPHDFVSTIPQDYWDALFESAFQAIEAPAWEDLDT